jgi:nucleoside permease NupC
MLVWNVLLPLFLLAVAGRYTGPDGKLLEIRNVWVDNLEEEMAKVIQQTDSIISSQLCCLAAFSSQCLWLATMQALVCTY